MFTIEDGVYSDNENTFPEMGFGTERAAVCSGISKQLHYGTSITEVQEHFPNYAEEIERAKEVLEQEGRYEPEADGFQDLFYETIIALVQSNFE